MFRIWLLVIHAELIGSTSELNQLMWWGLRMDLQTAAIMIAPAVIATALLHHRPTWRVWRHFIATYVAAIAGLALMLLAARLRLVTMSMLLAVAVCGQTWPWC